MLIISNLICLYSQFLPVLDLERLLNDNKAVKKAENCFSAKELIKLGIYVARTLYLYKLDLFRRFEVWYLKFGELIEYYTYVVTEPSQNIIVLKNLIQSSPPQVQFLVPSLSGNAS